MTCIEALTKAKENPGKIGVRPERWNDIAILATTDQFVGIAWQRWRKSLRDGVWRFHSATPCFTPAMIFEDDWATVEIAP